MATMSLEQWGEVNTKAKYLVMLVRLLDVKIVGDQGEGKTGNFFFRITHLRSGVRAASVEPGPGAPFSKVPVT